MAETDPEKAELFNNFFSSQTLLESGSSSPDKSSLTKKPHVFDSMKTTPKEVFDILCHLKKGKAAGIDELEIIPDLLCVRAGLLRVSLLSSSGLLTHGSSLPSGKRHWLYLSSRK